MNEKMFCRSGSREHGPRQRTEASDKGKRQSAREKRRGERQRIKMKGADKGSRQKGRCKRTEAEGPRVRTTEHEKKETRTNVELKMTRIGQHTAITTNVAHIRATHGAHKRPSKTLLSTHVTYRGSQAPSPRPPELVCDQEFLQTALTSRFLLPCAESRPSLLVRRRAAVEASCAHKVLTEKRVRPLISSKRLELVRQGNKGKHKMQNQGR